MALLHHFFFFLDEQFLISSASEGEKSLVEVHLPRNASSESLVAQFHTMSSLTDLRFTLG